ncbi:MAG TPA: hypothetical protein VFU21_03840 [Kofleriaceae bacterium]|nr:hypothetical protein [Kofleriaceae bacterium]
MGRVAALACVALTVSIAACLEAPPGSSVQPPDGDGAAAGDGASESCPEACDDCEADGTCVIRCGEGECGPSVICPPGRPCLVVCQGYTACEAVPIDCTAATACRIECLGHDACQAGVSCAGDSCSIVCMGTDACSDGDVRCDATVCGITCDGENACTGSVCCQSGECGAQCVSVNGGCCACAGC